MATPTPPPTPDRPSRPLTGPIIRALAILAIGCAFIFLASYTRPSNSTADPTMPPDTPGSADISIGWLESPDYRVEIFLTDEGTRYDVYDALGDPIAIRTSREDMYRIDPILDPDSMMGATSIGIVTDDYDF